MKIIKNLILGIVALLMVLSTFALEISSPESKTYNTTQIPLEFLSNQTLDNITYSLDNQSFLACENCSQFNDTINVSVGNHTLLITGKLGNQTFVQNVSFSVQTPDGELNETINETTNLSINLDILSPENIVYDTATIPLNFSTDINSIINYTLDNTTTLACSNCTSFSTIVDLEEGNHNLVVNAFSGMFNESKEVNFTVNVTQVNDTNQTDDQDDKDEDEGEPRFSLGFNKLPQAVANGEFSDAELAQIIRENKLNPGIINRLIKTGKLGNESIEAILETQFNPPGILKKILGFFGFKQSTFSELIYENYDLSYNNKQKIVTRDDLPAKYHSSVKSDLQENTDKKVEKLVTKTIDKDDKKPEKIKGAPAVKDEKTKVDKKTSVTNKAASVGKSDEKKGKKAFNAGKQNGKKFKAKEKPNKNPKNKIKGKPK